jgi:O-acetyl-ADP-ribose deacetylase (regulator of RNase III)
MRVQIASSILELQQGDITLQHADAIVNAANSALAGGGGVDGAIHRAGGESIMEETARRYPKGCPTGSAVASGAGNLPAKYIFHAVGPVWRGGLQGESTLLKSTYQSCLDLAVLHNCRMIAFPAISTGVYGYPLDQAAEHSLEVVIRHMGKSPTPELVRFVLFSAGAYSAFAQVLEKRLGT